MVKRPVTFLEETVFQHVTIHKLMIYIYNKIKISQDPLLAVIRTNILELKKMARCDPLVLVASSKTVLKTLLNFTRLSCISNDTLHFIRRLMQDVYARMRKLWEMYKTYGSYETPKKIKYTEKILGKENIETRSRKQLANCMKKKLSESSKNIPNTETDLCSKTSSTNEMDIASQIRESVASEIGTDGSFDKSSLLERIKSIFTDNTEKISQEADNDTTHSGNNDSETSLQLRSKSPKKRKIKKWSLGIFQAKRRKRSSNSSKRVKSVNEIKSDADDEFEEASSKLSGNNSIETPSVSEIVKENVPTEFDNLQKNEFHHAESLVERYGGCSIAMDPAWGQRLRNQREFYLNEMTKTVHRLNANLSSLPKYDIIDQITNKLDIFVTSYGYSLKELTAIDHSSLALPHIIPHSLTANDRTCMKMDSSTITAVVGTLKAIRVKKCFIYECNDTGCTIRTTQLTVLYHHVRKYHAEFEWDWSCSYCGNVQEIDYLKPACLLDMAMYHLTAFHSNSSLKRNPVELEFTEMELQANGDFTSKNSSALPTKDKNTSHYYSLLYKCVNCDFSSRLFAEALKHYTQEFNESKSLKCIYCLENQANPFELCEHLEDYHASSNYLCSLCHYRSVSSSNTANHYLDEHVDEENEKDLTQDIIIYVNADPVRTSKISPKFYNSSQLPSYICAHPDGEEFTTLIGWKFVQHISTCPNQGGKRNSGGKKFECPTCAVRVGGAYKLKQHFETHLVLRYNCIYCGLATPKLSTIKEHLYQIHMYWPPRFVIREDYDLCPDEIILQYSSLMKYETHLESLIEVSVEMDEVDAVNSRIKLQVLQDGNQPWDSVEKIPDVFYKTDPEDGSIRNKSDVIEIVSDSEEIDNSLDDPIKLPESHSTNSVTSCSSITTCTTTSLAERGSASSTVSKDISLHIPNQENMNSSNTNKPLGALLKTPSSNSSPSSVEPDVQDKQRSLDIRVISEAKLDNFRKPLGGRVLENIENSEKTEQAEDNRYPSTSENTDKSTGDIEIVPNVLRNKLSKSKQDHKTIQIFRVPANMQRKDIEHCPYCDYTVATGSALSRHISRNHNQINNYLITQEGRCFKCIKCNAVFEAFAFLHKHVTEEHPTDTYGFFSIYLKGTLLLRKNIKICFLCSTLIVSLEELYKHPDTCPFAHTTGTPLTSSIVYATGKPQKACFVYHKGEIKVNKSIVELLQPHQPKSPQSEEVLIVKRAVAKKSTGPRPLVTEPTNSDQINTSVKRAVAKKSTGPYAANPNN